MIKTPFVLGFTGHRPKKLNHDYNYTGILCLTIREKIGLILDDLKPSRCVVGGALGVDEIALQVCLEKNIPVTIAAPFEGHHLKWTPKAQARWAEYLKNPLVTIIYIYKHANDMAFQMRNMWIVDNCHKLVVVWDGIEEGGTYNCYNYAKRVRKDMLMMKLHERVTV